MVYFFDMFNGCRMVSYSWEKAESSRNKLFDSQMYVSLTSNDHAIKHNTVKENRLQESNVLYGLRQSQ